MRRDGAGRILPYIAARAREIGARRIVLPGEKLGTNERSIGLLVKGGEQEALERLAGCGYADARSGIIFHRLKDVCHSL